MSSRTLRIRRRRRCSRFAGRERRRAGAVRRLEESWEPDPLAAESFRLGRSPIAEGAAMAHHYSGPDFSFPHGDARVDHCDLFAFPSPGDASRSVLAIDVHPSFGINPDGPTTTEPFSPEAVYELKVDTNGDGVADVAFRVRVSVRDGAQSATVRRVEGADAAGAGDGGEILVEARSAGVAVGHVQSGTAREPSAEREPPAVRGPRG